MKNFILFIITGSFLASCSSIPVKQPIEFNSKVISSPDLNIETSQELGDTLMEYAILSSYPSWEIVKDYVTKKNFAGVYHIVHPQLLKPLTVNENGVKSFGASKSSMFGGLGSGGPQTYEMVGEYTYEGLCFNILRKECLNKDYITPKDYVDLNQPNVKQQLIYNGRLGDFVKFLYREVSEGAYLRQPFTQEIQYDLNEGQIIGFKGARLEIISATNRQITYKILEHFSPAL